VKIKASIIQADGSWTDRRLLVVHQPPRKGEWIELADQTWYEVVNLVYRGYGFNGQTDEKVAQDRLAPYGDKLGNMSDLSEMETLDVVVLLRSIGNPLQG